jgi:GDPmannose 4,6-dehydratase
MWLILQAEQPDDFVLATNETHTIREFIEETFGVLGEEITWKGEGLNETGILKSTGKVVVKIDPRYFRPAEVETLLGDPTKAREKLGWTPRTNFEDLVREMIQEDLRIAERDALVRDAGYPVYDHHE